MGPGGSTRCARGETVESIAAALHAKPAEIAEANDIPLRDGLDVGDELVIPVAAATMDHPQRYTVKRTDTLVTIADRFGVTTAQLRQWNHLTSTRTVASGRTIYVSAPLHLAPNVHVRMRKRKTSAKKPASGAAKSSVRSSVAAKKKTTPVKIFAIVQKSACYRQQVDAFWLLVFVVRGEAGLWNYGFAKESLHWGE